METRHVLAYISKAADAIREDDHSINFIVSTDTVDRDNERVMPEAVMASITKGDFANNPAALPCHLHRLENGMPPSVGHWDTDTAQLLKHRVEMRLNFAADTQLGGEYWKYYSKRHMRAVSIGFRIIDGHEEVINGKRIYIITKIELFEISCVPVGANAQALSKHKEWFTHTDDPTNASATFDVKAIADTILDKIKSQITIWINDSETIVRIDDSLEEIKSLLVHDHGEYARALSLDNSLDQPDPAGTASITEQKIKEMLMKAITNL